MFRPFVVYLVRSSRLINWIQFGKSEMSFVLSSLKLYKSTFLNSTAKSLFPSVIIIIFNILYLR